jgi:excisionase family DNA binding protein
MSASDVVLLSVRQVAERLGVTEAAVRRWLLERRIASVKVGRRLIRIPSSEIGRIVDAGFRPVRPSR